MTWEDIDLEKKTLRVDRNILKKNQSGGTKKRLIEGQSATVWYFESEMCYEIKMYDFR